MIVRHDPAMISSNYERHEADQYYTEPWVTKALVTHPDVRWMLEGFSTYSNGYPVIWEPAAGRLDMVKVIYNHLSNKVYCSDLFPQKEHGPIAELDFTSDLSSVFVEFDRFDCIITNPPFTKQDEFLIQAFKLLIGGDVNTVAFLLRSEFKHAKGRRKFFDDTLYAGELVLTKRPRWDKWWEGNAPKHSPRHNYSWYLWSNLQGTSTPNQWFWYEE